MYRFHKYLFTTSVVFAGTLLMAGCSQPEPAVEAPASDGSVEVVPPQGADSVAPPTSEIEATAETTLPEVRAVNTAQLGGLVEETLGKVTVLNIWATWCGPCVHEMPDLVKFYNETSRDSIAFLSLSVDAESEITGVIPEFQRAHQVPFPVYVLNERNDEGLAKALRGPFEGGIPATYIYDTTGKLRETVVGAVTLAELQSKVNPLLESKP